MSKTILTFVGATGIALLALTGLQGPASADEDHGRHVTKIADRDHNRGRGRDYIRSSERGHDQDHDRVRDRDRDRYHDRR